jgi:hypothetical protein
MRLFGQFLDGVLGSSDQPEVEYDNGEGDRSDQRP